MAKLKNSNWDNSKAQIMTKRQEETETVTKLKLKLKHNM